MSHRIAAKITGVAGCVPPKVLTNADLEKMVATNDEWIRTRTGIRERHIVEKGVPTSTLAVEAAKILLEQTKTDPDRNWDDHRGYRYAGHDVSGDGLRGAGAAGRDESVGLRSVRCVRGVCVCADRWLAIRGRSAQESCW